MMAIGPDQRKAITDIETIGVGHVELPTLILAQEGLRDLVAEGAEGQFRNQFRLWDINGEIEKRKSQGERL